MNELVFVTGASRGIGKAIQMKLLNEGYDVIGSASSDNGCAKIMDGVADESKCLAVHGDLKDPKETIDGWVEAIDAKFNRQPGIIIANAGITQDNLMLRMSDEQWYDVMQVNLNANYHLVKAFLKPMVRAKQGRFIFLGSVSALGNPGQANYSTTKAGICGLSRSIALEYGARNITSNVIAPGFIETDMTDELTEDQQKLITDKIPLKRYGQVNDVANLVSFLISDQAGYITGQTLVIDGGISII